MKEEINFKDAQELKRKYPETFYAPSAEDLNKIKPGDFVKICAYEERFWAEVISKERDIITARVDNDLLMWQLSYNETITFKANNVYDIIPELPKIKNSIQPKKKPEKRKGKGLK